MRTQYLYSENLKLTINDSAIKAQFINKKTFRKLMQSATNVTRQFLLNSKELQLAKQKKSPLSLSLTLCGERKIQSLNRNYRNKDKATDVLSFPIYENLREVESRGVISGSMLELGDIFICTPWAKKQAKSFGLSLEEEVVHLFVHGLLHLCGYDHEKSKNEEKIMFELEEKIVLKISKEVNK
jgi:probable rRNA maturation factor